MSARTVDYTLCDRSNKGHRWDEVDDPGTWQPDRKFFHRDVDRCERCGTYRFTGINAYGQKEATWYVYPDDWRDRWGVGETRPTGDEVRLRRIMAAREKKRVRSPV